MNSIGRIEMDGLNRDIDVFILKCHSLRSGGITRKTGAADISVEDSLKGFL
jgi:hypothetical protein